MLDQKEVNIQLAQGSVNEYIVRDNLGITIGRVYIIDLCKENKYCCFRIRFYKKGDEGYENLKITLNKLIITLFKNMDIFKINILAEEDVNLSSFTDLGFELEGIISNSIIKDNIYRDELLFGIDKEIFSNNIIRKISLKGKNVELKILTPENAEEILQYYINNKQHLEPFEPTRENNFYTLSVQKRTLIENYKQFLNGMSVNFGIYKSNKFIGKIQLSNIVMGVFRSCFVGYSIDKGEEGKGYMKEALSLSLEYAFKELDLHRVEASTLVNNLRSQNVLKTCGFQEIGLNKNYLYINGKWRDHITFYKIRQN
ncbi:ribosomal-protein-alanine N-acetyltransferase [Clostridium tetanomorphum]|uniref:GNAT family N-acetyltransferase n=1 Tax=Clostridium tetanomorphum TaxID=1553 RepID=A0A923EBU3_CLOTT|nr:GNAT family protein [Clostridium tetanomorphum]KAJ49590.1 ribosomal-protein-alanine acetyltransferase [Clostridium tetanomorphum DSM 665]KAJ49785.1 ribosomal-protein-alanine acetyltransferase [Clostridium tetanomorphum DSM 665]MBC2400185.1 GNAT family N-acetyltransferase [Clostridium tetanomorphum]MBP1866588.1 ribosomal-protein-alanine N-acetyltransferase [Clostridium tetanomorphum]NRS86683.1 ribosomal-protein-alanine N-acetyltransferase [Clostridium tetanomorphum]